MSSTQPLGDNGTAITFPVSCYLQKPSLKKMQAEKAIIFNESSAEPSASVLVDTGTRTLILPLFSFPFFSFLFLYDFCHSTHCYNYIAGVVIVSGKALEVFNIYLTNHFYAQLTKPTMCRR